MIVTASPLRRHVIESGDCVRQLSSQDMGADIQFPSFQPQPYGFADLNAQCNDMSTSNLGLVQQSEIFGMDPFNYDPTHVEASSAASETHLDDTVSPGGEVSDEKDSKLESTARGCFGGKILEDNDVMPNGVFPSAIDRVSASPTSSDGKGLTERVIDLTGETSHASPKPSGRKRLTRVPCEICGKAVAQVSRHMRVVHGDIKAAGFDYNFKI